MLIYDNVPPNEKVFTKFSFKFQHTFYQPWKRIKDTPDI